MFNIDVDVIEKTLSGETEAYGQLVQRYQKQVYRLAYRILKNSADAADITQETFLKAYQNLHTLKDKSKFGSWLMRIATNKCYNWIRSRQENLMAVEESLVCEHALHLPPAPDEILIQQELRNKVMKAIEELPELDRKVIQLFYLEENNYREIQQQLGLSKGALGRRLHQARNLLRQKLQSMYQFFPFLWDFRLDSIFKYISAKLATAFSTTKFFLISVMVHLMIMAPIPFLSKQMQENDIETEKNQAVHDITEVTLFTAPLATDFNKAFANQRPNKSSVLPALTQQEEPGAVVFGKGKKIEGMVHIAEPVSRKGSFWMKGKPKFLVNWLNERTQLQTFILDKKISLEEEFFSEPFLLFYGEGSPKMNPKEIANLKRYLLEKEGFLWVDIGGEESEKVIKSTKAFFKRILPKSSVELIKKEHDIYHNSFNIEVPPPGPSGVEKKELEGIFLSGRLAVLLTDVDYSHAFCLDTPYLPGVLRFSTNVIYYALAHGKISDYSQYKP